MAAKILTKYFILALSVSSAFARISKHDFRDSRQIDIEIVSCTPNSVNGKFFQHVLVSGVQPSEPVLLAYSKTLGAQVLTFPVCGVQPSQITGVPTDLTLEITGVETVEADSNAEGLTNFIIEVEQCSQLTFQAVGWKSSANCQLSKAIPKRKFPTEIPSSITVQGVTQVVFDFLLKYAREPEILSNEAVFIEENGEPGDYTSEYGHFYGGGYSGTWNPWENGNWLMYKTAAGCQPTGYTGNSGLLHETQYTTNGVLTNRNIDCPGVSVIAQEWKNVFLWVMKGTPLEYFGSEGKTYLAYFGIGLQPENYFIDQGVVEDNYGTKWTYFSKELKEDWYHDYTEGNFDSVGSDYNKIQGLSYLYLVKADSVSWINRGHNNKNVDYSDEHFSASSQSPTQISEFLYLAWANPGDYYGYFQKSPLDPDNKQSLGPTDGPLGNDFYRKLAIEVLEFLGNST